MPFWGLTAVGPDVSKGQFNFMKNFLERDLEQIIYETDQTELTNRGLHCLYYDKIFRQVNLGAYGVADIITVKYRKGSCRQFCVTIYELKQSEINVSTLMQCCRYLYAIKDFISNNYPDYPTLNLEYKIVIVGERINTNSDFTFLLSSMPNTSAFTYKYKFNGISFAEHGEYAITDPKYPNNLKGMIKNITRELIKKHQPLSSKDSLPF